MGSVWSPEESTRQAKADRSEEKWIPKRTKE